MSLQLIADHIQHEREAHAEHARLERLARERRPGLANRLRIAAARRIIELGLALGGEAARPVRAHRLPSRPVL